MAGELIYAFRVMRLPLLDAGGATIGQIEDIVVVPGRAGARAAGRSASSPPASGGGSSSTPPASPTSTATGCGCAAGTSTSTRSSRAPARSSIGRDLIDQQVGDETVSDVALRPRRATAARRGGRSPRSGSPAATRCAAGRATGWSTVDEVPGLFAADQRAMAAEAARLRDMHPSDVAGVVRAHAARPAPPARRGDGRRAPRRPARGAARGRAAADHRGPRPRPADQRARRDGVRRPRRPARRDARRAAQPRSSTRWTTTTPTSCAACCPTRRARPAA